MVEDEHPDPTGPEPAENPDAARDGDTSNVRPLPPRNGAGTPLADREQEAETKEEEDGQFTIVIEELGKEVTLSSLLKRGVETEVRYTMSGRSIPSVKGGLLDPFATSLKTVADNVVDSVKFSYVRDGEGKVEKVIQYVTLKPRIIHPAKSEAARVMLGLTAADAA